MTASRPIVLYDEACGMCMVLAEWLADRAGGGLSVAAIGSPVGDVLLRDLTPAERYASVHVVDAAGRRSSAGAAVPVILATLPHGRVPAWLARRTPRATELGYRLVARHRGTISKLLGVSRAQRRATDSPPAGARSRGGRQGS